MKETIKDFISNLKEYVSYLMKVNFKDLFINTLILVCIIVLSTFVYVPVGLVDDLVLSFIQIFFKMSILATQIYHWIFKLISFFLSLYAFMYLFNLRFKDVKEKGLNSDNKDKKGKENDNTDSKVDIDLPKKKDE